MEEEIIELRYKPCISSIPVWFFHNHSEIVYHYIGQLGVHKRVTFTEYVPIDKIFNKKNSVIEYFEKDNKHFVKIKLINL